MARIGSFVILFKDDKRDKVFLVLRSDFPIWNLTGGGVEAGESPKDAAIREAWEETGFKVKITRKIGVYKFSDPKTNKTVLTSHFFEGRRISGVFQPEFSECKGAWFDVNNLPVDVLSNTKSRIFDAINFDGKEYSKTMDGIYHIKNLHILFRHPIAAVKYFTLKRSK